MEPMRVLHMVDSLGYQGVEAVVMNYYRHMDLSRVQFDFIITSDLPQRYHAEVEKMGGKIYRLPGRARHPIAYSKALKRLFSEHPDYRIFHAHANSASIAVDLAAAKRCGIPVRIAHSHSTSCFLKAQHYLLKLILAKQYTHAFACTKEAGNWVFGKKPIQIWKNGIELDRFLFQKEKRDELRKQLEIDDKTVLLHVGAFRKSKNHLFLLDIFQAFLKRNPDAVLLLIGQGELESEVVKKAKLKNLTDKVMFLGIKDNVQEYFWAADMMLFPSAFEGLGLAVIEAQCASLKCISSDRVPDEVDVSELSFHLSLDESSETWAEMIQDQLPYERVNVDESIKKAGYDILECAKKLEQFYLDSLR